MYILSQISAIISTIFLGISYFAKDKKNIMLLCVIYCIFYAFHYLLLGAITGTTMTIISSIRNIWFYKRAKREKNNNSLSLIVFMAISLLGLIITYKDIFSIVSMTGNIISTYSVWQSRVLRYRILSVLGSICFLIYALSISSLFAIITEIILMILEFISIYKYKKEGIE